MSFAAINAAADEMKRTHHERQAAITRAHFERHPECRRIILKMDADCNIIRGRGEINVAARCQPRWFNKSMWKHHADEQRPVESGNCTAPKEIPYRLVAEMTTREAHLPDIDFGTVNLPDWIREHYLPALKELYPHQPVPTLPQLPRHLVKEMQRRGLVSVVQGVLTGVL